MSMTLPVIRPAAGDKQYATALATSQGCTKRPNGRAGDDDAVGAAGRLRGLHGVRDSVWRRGCWRSAENFAEPDNPLFGNGQQRGIRQRQRL